MKEKALRESIVAEYLCGELSYRELEEKHGVNIYQIRPWVLKHQGRIKKPIRNQFLASYIKRGAPPTDVKVL